MFLNDYNKDIWHSIYKTALTKNINLICFPGAPLGSNYHYHQNKNYIYNFVDKNQLDGLISLFASLSNYIGQDEFSKFLNQFHPLPMVSIGLLSKNAPSILVDNKNGMKALISHFIKDHGCQKIAFISGTLNNPESIERFTAYKECLQENGIPFDEKMIFYTDYALWAIEKNILSIIKKQGAVFDAIVASNDYIALEVIRESKKHNIRVPEDILVGGFDDCERSGCSLPPLTTVRQPLWEIGQKSIELIIAILQNKKTPEKIILAPKLILRHSCGCFWSDEKTFEDKSKNSKDIKFNNLKNWEKKLINDFKSKLKDNFITIEDNPTIYKWSLKLANQLFKNINNRSINTYEDALNKILEKSFTERIKNHEMHKIIFLLGSMAKENFKNPKM